MAGFIDLTGKDPFSQYMPRANSVLNSTAGNSLNPLTSLLPDLLPSLGSLLSQTKTDASSSTAVSGLGNVYFGNTDPFTSLNKNTNQNLNTAITIALAGLVLIALVKAIK